MVEQVGEWWFKCVKSPKGGGYMAWCAKSPDLGDSPLSPAANVEVHFEFGATENETLRKLKAEVLQ